MGYFSVYADLVFDFLPLKEIKALCAEMVYLAFNLIIFKLNFCPWLQMMAPLIIEISSLTIPAPPLDDFHPWLSEVLS